MDLRTLPWTSELVVPGPGHGRVLLFAGFGSSPEPLRELAEALRDRSGATVIVAGLARHEGNDAEFRASRSWHYLEAAERRFDEFVASGAGPIVVGGYSTGALVALLIQARHPGRVHGVVLLSPALRLSTTGKQLVGYSVLSTYYVALPLAMLATVGFIVSRQRRRAWSTTGSTLAVLSAVAGFTAAAAGVRALTVPMSPGEPVVRDGERVLPPHFTRASLLTGSSLVPLQLAARWRLSRAERPVCIVFGERDDVVDVRFGTLRATQAPSAELHVVPHATHRVATDRACHELVSDFVHRALAAAPATAPATAHTPASAAAPSDPAWAPIPSTS